MAFRDWYDGPALEKPSVVTTIAPLLLWLTHRGDVTCGRWLLDAPTQVAVSKADAKYAVTVHFAMRQW